jgi:surface polysaccharide O-acyltransferase-like enzyme
MDKYLSDKIKLLSFLAIVLVVILHSNNGFLFFYQTSWTDYSVFTKNFISNNVTLIAVPFFFTFSGYLFFINYNATSLLKKLKKRITTLILPYLIWSAIGLVTLFVFSKAWWFESNYFDQFSLTKLIFSLSVKPIPFQLWFLRNLILLTLISPIIYLAINHFSYSLAIASGLLWLGNFDLFPSKGYIYGNQSLSLFFYVLGATIALKGKNIVLKNHTKPPYLLLLAWVTLLFINTYFDSISILNINPLNMYGEGKIILLLSFKLAIVLGIVSIWRLYDFFFYGKAVEGSWAYKLSSYTFFIYACHEPLQTFVKSTLSIFSWANHNALVLYLLIPTITILSCLALGIMLKKYLSTIYGWATGGR